ncbi:MAG: hypothetical protein KIT22_10130 [Verrucomicrobiae bacterium]|nr:hypothetical protein [Verrucomicrobiae bacterium]
MTTQAQQAIREMHEAYCRESGMRLPLDAAREMQWWEPYRRGIRAADVTDLIRWMKWKKQHDQPCRSLTFRNFVGNPDYMEEDLAELRSRRRGAQARAAHQMERASVLRASGRPGAPEPPPGRPAAAVLDTALSDDFEELKRKIREGVL